MDGRYYTEEYRKKRRAAYAEKHANEPMTKHRQAMIRYWKNRKSKSREELQEEKLNRMAYEQAMKDIRDDQTGNNDKESKMEKKVERLMQRFYKLYTNKSTKRICNQMNIKDQEYYVRRAVEYRNLGENIDKLDIVADRTSISAYGYKRNVIWQEFYELTKKMGRVNEE